MSRPRRSSVNVIRALVASRSASSWESAAMAHAATASFGVSMRCDGSKLVRYSSACDAPRGLMKSANAYGRPCSAAQIALCIDEPRSHGTGASGRPGSSVSRRRVVGRHPVLEQRQELGELLGEVVGRGLAAVALERERRHRIGAGGAADAEVDAAREEPGQDREVLRDLQRAVVGEHDAAAADPQVRRRGRDRADQHLR